MNDRRRLFDGRWLSTRPKNSNSIEQVEKKTTKIIQFFIHKICLLRQIKTKKKNKIAFHRYKQHQFHTF